jgi:hypothetical protein
MPDLWFCTPYIVAIFKVFQLSFFSKHVPLSSSTGSSTRFGKEEIELAAYTLRTLVSPDLNDIKMSLLVSHIAPGI